MHDLGPGATNIRFPRVVDLPTVDISPDVLIPNVRILFVDDDDLMLRVGARVAEKEGWVASCASNAFEALHILERELVSVVISDYNMPHMNGIELLSAVRKCRPDVARVLMTGSMDDNVFERAVNRAGIAGFLRKPWSRADLRHLVEVASEGLVHRRVTALRVARLEEVNEGLIHAVGRIAEANDMSQGELERHLEMSQAYAVQNRSIIDALKNDTTGGRCGTRQVHRERQKTACRSKK